MKDVYRAVRERERRVTVSLLRKKTSLCTHPLGIILLPAINLWDALVVENFNESDRPSAAAAAGSEHTLGVAYGEKDEIKPYIKPRTVIVQGPWQILLIHPRKPNKKAQSPNANECAGTAPYIKRKEVEQSQTRKTQHLLLKISFSRYHSVRFERRTHTHTIIFPLTKDTQDWFRWEKKSSSKNRPTALNGW